MCPNVLHMASDATAGSIWHENTKTRILGSRCYKGQNSPPRCYSRMRTLRTPSLTILKHHLLRICGKRAIPTCTTEKKKMKKPRGRGAGRLSHNDVLLRFVPCAAPSALRCAAGGGLDSHLRRMFTPSSAHAQLAAHLPPAARPQVCLRVLAFFCASARTLQSCLHTPATQHSLKGVCF